MSECPENLLHILQILKKEFKESNEIFRCNGYNESYKCPYKLITYCF